MTVEPIVTAWLHAEAPSRARPGLLDAALERVAVTPQERVLWRRGSSAGDRWSFLEGVGRGLPRGFVLVALLALLAVALVGAALLGARLLRLDHHSWHLGSLVYALDGDVFFADADGANARKVLDGVPGWVDGVRSDGPTYGFVGWAPNGRQVLLLKDVGARSQQPEPPAALLIGDADGRVIASIPGWGDATWSPDSTRIEAWSGASIGIYGTDGTQHASLPLPDGYVQHRESGGLWARDGRSVFVQIQSRSSPGAGSEYWQLPVDGSAPRPMAEDDILAELDLSPSFSRDGRYLAGVSSGALIVAEADGTDRRVVGHELASDAILSPTGTQIAYIRTVALGSQLTRDELRVVDVSSGQDRAVASLPDQSLLLEISLLEWSPSGDRIVLRQVQTGVKPGASLFSVDTNTGAWDLVVDGVSDGAWQWIPDEGVE